MGLNSLPLAAAVVAMVAVTVGVRVGLRASETLSLRGRVGRLVLARGTCVPSTSYVLSCPTSRFKVYINIRSGEERLSVRRGRI